MAAHRTPVELIKLYWSEVWNNRNVELIREICADPILRHDPRSTTRLSHDEQIERVRDQTETRAPFFSHEVLHGDDTYVTSVWNMHTRKGDRIELSGIEVFKAENGRFTDCWNSTYSPGYWGVESDPSVPADLPPPNLLASPDEVTPAWVQRLLAAAGVAAPRIGLVTIEPIGHGNMSETAKADIAYNAVPAGAPRSLICKFASRLPGVLALASATGQYEREIATYRFLGAGPPVRVPHAYMAQCAPGGAPFNLVLEDMTGKSLPGNQIAGCSPDEAALVVHELGELHASFWGREDLAHLPWLLDRRAINHVVVDAYRRGATIFRQRFDGRLSADVFEVIECFSREIKAFGRATRPYRTLLHGEIRLDNVLFETGVGGSTRACLIDWQMTALGDPQYDLAYFLTGALTPEDRRKCERDLIAAHAQRIGKVDPGYSVEVALDAFRFNALAGLAATVGASTVLPQTAHTDRLLTVLAERNAAAAQDWDALDLLATR